MIKILQKFVKGKTTENEIRVCLPSISYKTVSQNSINLIYILDRDIYIINLFIDNKNNRFYFNNYKKVNIRNFVQKYEANNFSIINFISK